MLLIFTLMVAIMSSSIFNLTWCLITALSCSLHVEIRRSLQLGSRREANPWLWALQPLPMQTALTSLLTADLP